MAPQRPALTPDAPAAESGDTKTRILDAAERQFAEHGFAGTSMRALTEAAGVNLAAVNYHFGSKRGLLRAVLERRVGLVTEERLKALAALKARADGAPLAIEDVVDAFLRPVLATREAGEIRQISALLFREPIETMGPVILDVFGETAEAFIGALETSLPHLERGEVAERFQFMIGAMVQIASGHLDYLLGALDLGSRTQESLFESAKRFLVAGLRANARSQPASGRGEA